MALAPDLWRLRELQTGVQQAGLEVADSYVSLTEVSEYAKGMPEEMLDARLHPKLPPEGKRAICFYPMTKRRGDGNNRYPLPYEDPRALMRHPRKSGRDLAGLVAQPITRPAGRGE